MEMGLRNLLQQLGKNESPYYDASPFIIPRDEEGNIIEFEQPNPKPFYPGDFEDIEPEDLIQPLGSEEIKERFIINSMPTTKEGFEMFTNKFMRLNEEGKMMYEMLIEKNPDAGAEKILDAIMKRSEFLSNEETAGDILEERTQSKANGGIINARRGAYMRATAGGTDRKKSSNYGGRKSNSTKTQKSGSKTQKKSTKSSTGYDNRSNAASGNANKNSNKKQTIKTGLEALIDRKDELKNIPANDGSGRNQYQVEINKFKSTPGGKKIFKKRFPNPLVKVAQGIGNYVKQGGALGILANALGGGKKTATEFGKDASNMAKDLAGMFGLDGLMGKLVNIAGGKDTNDFNKVIQNNQTSTRMRNNLAYGDPLGLNNEPFYKDEILRNLQNQVRQNTLDPYGAPNPAFGTDQFDPVAYNDMLIEDQLQKENTEEDPFGFNLTDQYSDTINLSGDPNEVIEDVSETKYDTSGLRKQIDMNTEQDDIFTNNAFMGAGPNFPAGGVGDGNSPSELNFYGGDTAFADTPEGRAALEALRSNQNQSFINMSGIVGNKATGGYMSSFPNQNLNTESLSASDNIDDRIMKNLEFEKMSPGMMGYNQGGKVMSTYDKLKAIADNNYG